MFDGSDAKHYLQRGDRFVQQEEDELAVEQYVLYCAHLQSLGGHQGPDATRFQLRLAAVRKQILKLMPERRDVRRALVENFAALGLIADARAELQRLAREWEALGVLGARDEALERLGRLG